MAAGLQECDAAAVSYNLTEAERRGVYSHGLLLVPMYLNRIASGAIARSYSIAEVYTHGACVLLDGGSGPGQSIAFEAVRRGESRADELGVGLVTVRNSNHIGMLATYAMESASRGYVALIMTNASPSIGLPGGGPIVGNNAFCFAAPVLGTDPICLDMATGVVATGKVRALLLCHEPLPSEWLSDENGNPSADGRDLDRGGFVLAQGGYKGFGLSIVIDLLTAVLAGGASSIEMRLRVASGAAPGTTQTFLIIAPSLGLARSSFSLDAAKYIQNLQAAAVRSDGKALLPGDLELQNARSKFVLIRRPLYDAVASLAEQLGVPNLSYFE